MLAASHPLKGKASCLRTRPPMPHALALPILLMCLLTGCHTHGNTPSSSSRLRACPKGSPLPVLLTPGCTPSSSSRLRMCPKGSPLPILVHPSHVSPDRNPPTHMDALPLYPPCLLMHAQKDIASPHLQHLLHLIAPSHGYHSDKSTEAPSISP